MVIKLFVLLLVCLIVLILYKNVYNKDSEGFLGFIEDFANYKKCPEKKVRGITKKIFDKYDVNDITEVNNNNKKDGKSEEKWDLYMPCGYNRVERELLDVKPENKNQMIYGISGCDRIVSKNSLWSVIKDKFGRDKASKMMPETYVLGDKQDMKDFQKKFNKNEYYVLKKNVQRKQGIKFSNNLDEINSASLDNFKLVQKYISDCFVINKRKLNLRIYMVVICHNGNIEVYGHRLGKCLYTSKDVSDSKVPIFEENVTNSYLVEKDVIKNNPLTLDDLERYLDSNGYDGKLLFERIYQLMRSLSQAIIKPLCNLDSLKGNKSFQLFGLDVIFNDKLEPLLLEINKGPDMVPKDAEDEALKTYVQANMFQKVGVIEIKEKGYENGLIKLN